MTHLIWPALSVSWTLAGMGGAILVADVQTGSVARWVPDGTCWRIEAATEDETRMAHNWLADNRQTWTTYLPLVQGEAKA